MSAAEAPRQDEAVQQALQVVGLYGDPDVTWGISLEAVFEAPVELTGLDERLHAAVATYPHLGRVPVLEEVPAADWSTRRESSASAPFGEDARLVRLLVDSSRTRFFVTAHHGVCDGLGLIALMNVLTGRHLVSSARGVGEMPAQQNFLVSSVLRLAEAVFAPPARFSGTASVQAPGTPERMTQADGVAGRINGARVTAALLAVHDRWPRRRSSGGRRFLTVMGASRREQGTSEPDRQTAYLRIPLRAGWARPQVEDAVKAAVPEPDFPETSAGGIGPLITRTLKNRLGYTVNVSNLGRVSGEGLVSMSMFPAVNGPQAVGVGLVSTERGATISLRTRRAEFSDAEIDALLQQVLAELARD